MEQNLHRDMGDLRARMLAVEGDLRELKTDVREIRDTLATFRGGWRALALIVAASASLGAVVSKIAPFILGR
jgi:hypothetical protein